MKTKLVRKNQNWKHRIIVKMELLAITSIFSLTVIEGFLGFIGKSIEEVEPALLCSLFILNITFIVLVAQKMMVCSSEKKECACQADNNL